MGGYTNSLVSSSRRAAVNCPAASFLDDHVDSCRKARIHGPRAFLPTDSGSLRGPKLDPDPRSKTEARGSRRSLSGPGLGTLGGAHRCDLRGCCFVLRTQSVWGTRTPRCRSWISDGQGGAAG